ncbi:MAG: hypothetical protein V3T58_04370 [Candidatus Hydrothermarchaeales archaeon]
MSSRVLLLAMTLMLIPSVYAQSCGDLVLTVRGLQSPAFDEYYQLNDMKQDALLILYGRERATCPEEVIGLSSSTIEFIEDFSVAYNLSRSEARVDRVDALEKSVKLVGSAAALSRYTLGIEAEDLINSAQQASREFLIIQGKAFLSKAESASATKDKIFNYKQATVAYEAAGETLEAANLRMKWKALEESYSRDMEKADVQFVAGESKYSLAKQLLSRDIFSRIEAYTLTREASIHFEKAAVYYEYHREQEKIRDTVGEISATANTLQELRNNIGLYFAISGIALLGVALFLINRLKAWNNDAYDYNLGNELVQVSTGET